MNQRRNHKRTVRNRQNTNSSSHLQQKTHRSTKTQSAFREYVPAKTCTIGVSRAPLPVRSLVPPPPGGRRRHLPSARWDAVASQSTSRATQRRDATAYRSDKCHKGHPRRDSTEDDFWVVRKPEISRKPRENPFFECSPKKSSEQLKISQKLRGSLSVHALL